MTALTDLLAAVEAGEWPTKWIGTSVNNNTYINGIPVNVWLDGQKSFNGSLDAARALHDAVLPGFSLILSALPLTTARAQVGISAVGHHAEPARAWLIAILRALIAQEQAQ